MKTVKIILLCSGIFLNAAAALFFLLPDYQRLTSLNREKSDLKQQWQKQNQLYLQNQENLRDFIVRQHPYENRLKSLGHPTTLSVLLGEITQFSNTHFLQISAIKPEEKEPASGLKRQMIHIDANGKETALLHFFQFLFQQFWLTEIQNIQLSTAKSGMRMQATFIFYYVQN